MGGPKFTEGPWKAHKTSQPIGFAEWEIHCSDDGECVAEVVHEEADAHLMAASKDMYEALEAGNTGAILNGPELLERVAKITGQEYPKLTEALIHKAKLERQALNKATGRTDQEQKPKEELVTIGDLAKELFGEEWPDGEK